MSWGDHDHDLIKQRLGTDKTVKKQVSNSHSKLEETKSNSGLLNKKGIVRISKGAYENSWDLVSMIFKDFKPYHMEFSLHENGVYRFYGFSEKFDPVEEGSVIPFYEVICTWEEKDGSFSYRFEKR